MHDANASICNADEGALRNGPRVRIGRIHSFILLLPFVTCVYGILGADLWIVSIGHRVTRDGWRDAQGPHQRSFVRISPGIESRSIPNSATLDETALI